jgi:protein-arginine kinase activator protein McsA
MPRQFGECRLIKFPFQKEVIDLLRHCALGNHVFDDDGQEVKPMTIEESLATFRQHESVACKECWSKFTKDVEKMMKKLKQKKEL